MRLICSLNVKLNTRPRAAVPAGVILSELRRRANMIMQDVEFEEGTSYRDSDLLDPCQDPPPPVTWHGSLFAPTHASQPTLPLDAGRRFGLSIVRDCNQTYLFH